MPDDKPRFSDLGSDDSSSSVFRAGSSHLQLWRSRRDPIRINGSSDERAFHFVICVQEYGTGAFDKDDSTLGLAHRDIVVVSPFQLVGWVPQDRSSSCLIAAGSISNPLRFQSTKQRMTHVPGSHPLGQVLADYVTGMEEILSTSSRVTTARLIETLADLVDAALCATHEDTPQEDNFMSKLVAIEAAVDNQDFDATDMADLLAMPMRSMQKRFNEFDMTPSAWIWLQRLERARKRMDDPLLRAQSIGQIAFASGFRDLAHFSRRFRVSVGVPPREYRRRAMLKQAPREQI